jgi:hypothetical protein
VFGAIADAATGAFRARAEAVGVATNDGSDNRPSCLRENRGPAAALQQLPMAGARVDAGSLFWR